MNKGTIELQSSKVKLRRYTADDINILHEKLGLDPDMMKYTGWNPYHSLESTKEFISEIIEDYDRECNNYGWLIESNGMPVGIIGAYDYNEAKNSIEIGYSIFKEAWRNGYASDAVNLVCKHLLTTENYSSIIAWSAVENIGSKTILEKQGFIQTEIVSEGINVNGEKYDQAFYEKYKNGLE